MSSSSSINFDSIIKKLEETSTFNKECVVGGLKFNMRVLSFIEEMKLSKIIDEISENEDFSAINDWKKYVVSLSIYMIEGQKLPDVIEVSDGDSNVEKIERSLYLKGKLDDLPTKITETLFDIYTDLKDQSEKSIETDLKYTWFKDPEVRKKEEEERIKAERSYREKEINRLKDIANIPDQEVAEGPDESGGGSSNSSSIVYDEDINLQKVSG